MKLLYFHGFGSSGATGTAQSLRRELPGVEVVSPDIPLDPAEALPYLKELCLQEEPDLIVGTSMGGMYAQQMTGYKRLIINPAFWMSRISKVLKPGTFTYSHKRRDKQMQGRVTKEIIARFREMEAHQFESVTEENRLSCWGLFARHDTTVGKGWETFTEHYPEEQAAWFEGEHTVGDTIIKKVVVPKILEIVAAQKE